MSRVTLDMYGLFAGAVYYGYVQISKETRVKTETRVPLNGFAEATLPGGITNQEKEPTVMEGTDSFVSGGNGII